MSRRLYYRPGERIRYNEPKCHNNNFAPAIEPTDYTFKMSNVKLWMLITDKIIDYDEETSIGLINSLRL